MNASDKIDCPELLLELSTLDIARLEHIRRLWGEESDTKIISRAISIYEWFLTQKQMGYKIHVVVDCPL